jgi:hypothetical protein
MMTVEETSAMRLAGMLRHSKEDNIKIDTRTVG